MARYGWRPGDREPEANVKVPDPTVYRVDERGGYRVHEVVEPIVTHEVPTITPRSIRVSERRVDGIDDAAVIDNTLPMRVTDTGWTIRRVK